MRHATRALLSALAAAAITPAAHAQDARYPSRPVRLVVPAAPGGAMDIVARIASPKLGEELGQQIIVDNRPGAAGNIGMEVAARANPDGHTVMVGNIGNLALSASLTPSFPIRPLRDLAPVTQTVDTPNTVVVNPSLPARSIKALIDHAKANPNKLNVGAPSSNRLEIELFLKTAGITMTRVDYKGGAGPALVALMSNEINLMFAPVSATLSFIQSGKVTALAVVAAKRLPSLPDVPTLAQSGFPDMTSGSWQGIVVPKGTPRPVVNRLHAAFVKVMNHPDTRARLATGGVEVATSASPEAFYDFMKRETERWAKVVKDAGIATE